MKKEVLNPKDAILINVLQTCIDIAFEIKYIQNYCTNKTTKKLMLKEDFDANEIANKLSGLPVRLHENKLFVNSEDFKFSFTISSAPDMLKRYKTNVAHTDKFCHRGYECKQETVFKNYSLAPHKKDTAYFIGYGNRQEIFDIANSNLKNAIKANEQAPTKQSKNLVAFFQTELNELNKCVGEDWDKDIEQKKEIDESYKNEFIISFIQSKNPIIIHNYGIYAPSNTRLFKLFKRYDTKPIDDLDVVLPMLLADKISNENEPNFNAYIETIKIDIETKKEAWRQLYENVKYYSNRFKRNKISAKNELFKLENKLQAFFKYENEIKTLLANHCTNLM